MSYEVTPSLIEEAANRLRGVAVVTPALTSHVLDEISGTETFLKCENFQLTGAFKLRGAYHAVTRLRENQPVRVFATISSGNHAQGLALACRLHGVEAHVVMPKPFSTTKYRGALDYDAVVYIAETRPEAEQKLSEVVRDRGAVTIHPFNDPLVIAGQGTIMIELLEQVSDLDVVLAPVGGGGLLSGLCVVAEAHRPPVQIFACEPAGALDAIESVRQNRIVPMPHPDTIADGLRTTLGDRTLPILRRYLAGFFIVQEEEIVQAMRFAFERLKLVIEPSSAVALVPLLRREPRLKGKRVAVILTGGNMDVSSLWKH